VMVLMTGLSTLLFNGNPLLKFDGYYIIADYLEIPNLAERSKEFIHSRLKSSLFGLKSQNRKIEKREGLWLCFYGIASTIYRFFLTLLIAWMLSAKYLLIGVLLAVYAVALSIVWPIFQFFKKLWNNSDVPRVKVATAALTVPVIGFVVLCLLPAPAVKTVQGVVWLPDDAIVRVDSECEVQEVHVHNGSLVKAGEALFECFNPFVRQNAKILLAERDELYAEQSGLLTEDAARYRQIQTELDANNARLEDAQSRETALTIYAQTDGQFVVEGEFELMGQMLPAGALAAYLIPNNHTRTVRLALPESTSDANLSWQEIKVRAPDKKGKLLSHLSEVTHLSHVATYEVPSAALTAIGGGDLKASVIKNQVQLDEPAFDIEIAWPSTAVPLPIGSLVRVKLKSESEPLGAQWLKTWQRAFLGRVQV